MTDPNDMIYPDPARSAQQCYDNQAPMGLETGLTKREYFAGLFMQANLIGAEVYSSSAFADAAVQSADALIKALNKNI